MHLTKVNVWTVICKERSEKEKRKSNKQVDCLKLVNLSNHDDLILENRKKYMQIFKDNDNLWNKKNMQRFKHNYNFWNHKG